jgi:hypothetical protein|eukprot:COSAG01_NODE_7914_length_2995_cov_70.311119_5_plen_94_part_00
MHVMQNQFTALCNQMIHGSITMSAPIQLCILPPIIYWADQHSRSTTVPIHGPGVGASFQQHLRHGRLPLPDRVVQCRACRPRPPGAVSARAAE